MKNFIVLTLVALLGLSACKGGKASQKKTMVQSDFKLVIEHTGCRGMCPVYTYAVGADGTASYEGRRAVEREGKWTRKLAPETLTNIVDAVNASGFWTMDAVYGGEVADLPSVIIEFTHAGQTHKVQNIRYAPESFNALAEKLEGWIDGDNWIEVK